MRDMSPNVFEYMLQFCAEALKSSDSSICSQVAISLDYIFSFIVKQKMRRGPSGGKPGVYLLSRVDEIPGVVRYIMSRLFELVFFEDHPSQWTFTRALLPLILANKEVCALVDTAIVFRLLY